nr:PREDICTED: inositol 1,4,5-trisphosphate receptor-interacting protein-like 1 [Opisthocomus hoazin]
MAFTGFFATVLQILIQYPRMVGDELDEATRKRMQQHAEQLSREMTRLLRDIEQKRQEQRRLERRSPQQSSFAWGALLFAALQQWQFWVIAGVLLLLCGLCWWLRRWSHELDRNSDEDSSSSARDSVEEEPEEEGDNDDANDLGRFLEEHIQWPVQNLASECHQVEVLMSKFILVFRLLLRNSFFPVPQPAIGVGSAFEGWSPRETDITYRMLVPLQSPRGCAFHLELGTVEQMLARNFRIHVEPVCTCQRQQLPGEMLCFLHQSEEELRRNQEPSLLQCLCTGSYLDVHKTARWIYQLVRASWVVLPESSHCRLTMLPLSRSCKFKVTKDNKQSLCIEMMFGVQQGKTDIFVSSQSTEATFSPSTMWSESYAVAEAKFFRHMATQAPKDSFHLRCLQICARILVGMGFSTYNLKTATFTGTKRQMLQGLCPSCTVSGATSAPASSCLLPKCLLQDLPCLPALAACCQLPPFPESLGCHAAET